MDFANEIEQSSDGYIDQLNETIEHTKAVEQNGKDAIALAENTLFKKLILEGYFRDEAARLAEMISSPNIDDKTREDIRRDINGIGALKRYLSNKVRMGEMAASDRMAAEAALIEIRSM